MQPTCFHFRSCSCPFFTFNEVNPFNESFFVCVKTLFSSLIHTAVGNALRWLRKNLYSLVDFKAFEYRKTSISTPFFWALKYTVWYSLNVSLKVREHFNHCNQTEPGFCRSQAQSHNGKMNWWLVLELELFAGYSQ